MSFRSITPNININTTSAQLRTELNNTFSRLDGMLQSVPSVLTRQTGPIGNTAATDTALFTYTVPQNTLATIGTSVRINAAGRFAANGNNKTLSLKFGGSALASISSTSFNDMSWSISGEIVSTGAASQIWYLNFTFGTSSLNFSDTDTSSVSAATNQTLSVNGNGAGASDVQAYYWKLEQLK